MSVQPVPTPVHAPPKPKRSHHRKKTAPVSAPAVTPAVAAVPKAEPPAPPLPAAKSAQTPAVGAGRRAVPSAEPNTEDALQADPQRGISAILRALRDADLDMSDEEAYALVKRLKKQLRALPLELD